MDVQQNPKGMVIAGWVLSVIPALMLLSGTYFALTGAPMVVEGLTKYGFPLSLVKPIGLIELGCALFLLIPQTAFYGAILFTAYLGGAVVTHLRAGESNWPAPIVFSVIIWAAVTMRDSRLRAFIAGK
jgi:hypothetical protein